MRGLDRRGRALLWLFLLASVGNLVELLLLEHFDSATQWLPLALLAVGATAAAVLLVAPEAAAPRRAWTPLMALYVATGPIGVFLHLKGNLEFELELDGALTGWALWRETVMGATPALAPGAMLVLGVLGWLALRPAAGGTVSAAE